MHRLLHGSLDPGSGPGTRAAPAVLAALVLAAAGFGLPARDAMGSGPGESIPAGDTLRLVDDRGDTLRLEDGPARRIVSLIPAATEILFAVGAGDRVVGRTRYGVHPPAAREVPSVGEGIRPSVEAILARRPDVVVAFAGASNRAALERLRELSVPLLALEHNSLADFGRNVARMGRLTGREAAADSLRQAVRRALEEVGRVADRRPRRRVYYEVWADPPITVGKGSYLDSLIAVAGGRNVFDDMSLPSPQVSLEAIASRAPDVVIVSRDTATSGAPLPSERPGWSAVRAVREGRVRAVDGGLVHRLGPRLGEAAAALAAAVHPGLRTALERAGFLAGER